MSDHMGRHKEHIDNNPVIRHDISFGERLHINRRNGLAAAVAATGGAITAEVAIGWSKILSFDMLRDTGWAVTGTGITIVAASIAKRGLRKEKPENAFTGRSIGFLATGVGAIMLFGAYKGEDTHIESIASLTTSISVENSSVNTVATSETGRCRIVAPIPSKLQVEKMSKPEQEAIGNQIEEFRTDINAVGVPIAISAEYGQDLSLAVSKLETLSGLTPEQADAEKWGQADCERFAKQWPAQFGDYWVQG